MAIIGGPKTPDPAKAVGGKLLHLPTAARTQSQPDLPAPHGESPKGQGFDPNVAKGTVLPQSAPPSARGAAMRVRLAGMGQLPIKTAAKDAARIKDTPLGKVLDSSVTIQSAAGLRKLEGVVRVSGDLTLQESVAKSHDLLVLASLIEVGGRLTIEGNGAIGALAALESLERARGIYIGFNHGLTKIALPKLKELQAAFIIEHNANLVNISLPSFTKGGRYLHVHENAALVSLSLPQLASLSDELSLLDNPHLTSVKVGSKDQPARIGTVEVRGNGAASFAQLFAHA